MKKICFILIISLCMPLLLFGCNGSSQVTEAPTPSKTGGSSEDQKPTEKPTEKPADTSGNGYREPSLLDKSKNYKFLFIGNSYTHYHTMPESIFAEILSSAGYTADVEMITKGGWYLMSSANSTDEVGAQVDKALADNDYDFIVLQEQSTSPSLSPEKFYTGVRRLAAKVKADGATPILYGTWSRKTGSNDLTENNWTNESMTWTTSAAYSAIGKELGIDVAYAGLAFFDVYTNHPEIELYDPDKSHPSKTGSYLAALTLFARITGVDPTTVEYNAGLNEATASILKEAARDATFEAPSIPEEYKTSSKGIKHVLENMIDTSKMKNLSSLPSSELISVVRGGSYPNGKSFSGILGTKNAVASTRYSTTGLSAADKADIADIGYGLSVIGLEKMANQGALENLVNGHWGASMMSNLFFDSKTYNINGEEDPDAYYTSLITLNFGSRQKFDAIGFSSGNLQGFPGVAEVYVSDDGENWTLVPSACWNTVQGTKIKSCGKTPADPWNSNVGPVTCLFDMEGVTGQYIRMGVIVGRSDKPSQYNTINTRELLVYGEKLG